MTVNVLSLHQNPILNYQYRWRGYVAVVWWRNAQLSRIFLFYQAAVA